MDSWFDRRHCVICNHPPTRFANSNIPDSMITTVFEESPSVPSSSPPTATNSTQPPPAAAASEDAITIHFNNKPLTLSLPSLSNVTVNNNVNNCTANSDTQVTQPHALIHHDSDDTKPKSGTGPTYKCKQCFARVHLDCIECRVANTNNADIHSNTQHHNNSDDILCPVCVGNASMTTQLNYKHLEKAIEEEENLLRDWSHNECVACGDVGELMCCDLCFYDEDDDGFMKVDGAAQFHLKCVIEETDTIAAKQIVDPEHDPFICPICRREFGANRLQSLHFYQRRRTKEREKRMQLKAEKAQQYIKQIGFRVDEIKTCVFCRQNSDDTAAGVFFDKENEFIGPFYVSRSNTEYWAHYQCVMWAPQVFMNEDSTFENVEREIKRSRGLTCSVCGKHGAVLGCYERGCYSTYHYPCAKQDAHCYFDNDLFAIYCPSHYFVHFMQNTTTTEIDAIPQDSVYGMNPQLYEKARFDPSISGKRKCAKSSKPTDVCHRYRAAADVWNCLMKQQHKHSASVSVSPMSPSIDARYLTRARRKQIEERKKKKYKASLMSRGRNRKRSLQNYLNNNNGALYQKEKPLSPHEVKRRKVFNLQPVLINDKTCNMNIQIEPDTLDIDDLCSEYDMASQIGGCDNAINVLKETVLLPLLYPQLFKSFALKPAKGVILYGPPGTGKTLLVRSLIKYYYAMSKAAAVFNNKAQSISISSPSPKALKNPNIRYASLADAVAVDHKNETDAQLQKHQSLISFFSRRGPDLLSKFHGETERNLRSLFARAQELAPSIIFFDEIDGMAPIRSHKHEQVNNSVVATLLSLMDGLDNLDSNKVFVIAATNRIDNLDPALRRPGRFDREIYIGLPNMKQRYKILRIHTNKWNICDEEEEDAFDEYLKYISTHKTIGFSGADLAALCNETFMNCIHRLCPQLKQCTEYKEEIANQLQTENIRVSIHDFQQTLDADGFKSSAVRNDISARHSGVFDMRRIDNLSANAKRRLDELMQRMDIYVNRCKNDDDICGVPCKAMHCVDDIDTNSNSHYIRSIKQARLISQYNDRILICSDDNHWLISFVLHKLDIANVQYVSIPQIAAQPTRQDTYHYILNKIALSMSTGIGVIVMYDLDIWLTFYPKLMETILLSNVKDMCRDRNTLILATSNQKWNSVNCWKHQWPQAVYQYFSTPKHNFFIQ